MTAFNPGDLVMFTLGRTNHIGTVTNTPKPGHSLDYTVETPTGNSWFIPACDMTLLPAGTPVFRTGQQVRVAPDAPFHAGRHATIVGVELSGPMLGYWLIFGGSGQAWIPAEALTATAGEWP